MLLRLHSPLLRDADIRGRLHVWLRLAHEGCTDTTIVEELKVPRPSARIDLAVINGELAGFEIKSDVDDLSRLPRQVHAFGCVFDRVTIVTTAHHLKQARQIVPAWWGILTVGQADQPVVERRKPKKNPSRRIDSLLHLHTKRELIDILTMSGLEGRYRTTRRPELIQLAKANISDVHIREASRSVLKNKFRRVP